jgi:hypothetical protein
VPFSLPKKKLEAEYIYSDAKGKPLFRKLRWPGKHFTQERNEGGAWASGLEGIMARPLYNLAVVMAAKNVVFTEGEKDADNLTRIFSKLRMRDWAATTNFDGASAPWRREYDDPLRGKNVWMLADNDDAGRAHAHTFASAIACVAARVSLIEFLDLPEHADVSDYLLVHPSGKELRTLLKTSEPWQDPLQSIFLTAPELMTEGAEEIPWLVKDFVLRGSSSVLQAEPKMGKSTFTLMMVKHKLTGKPFLDRVTTKGAVVYLTEMTTADMKRELTDCGLTGAADLHILPLGKAWGLDWQQVVDLATARCRIVGADLLVIDTFHEWTQNPKQDDAGAVMAVFRPLVPLMDAGIAIWIETHERKSGGSIAVAGRGSNVLAAKASVIVSLRRPPGNLPPSYRQIEVAGRHGRFEEIDKWESGEYRVVGKTPAVITQNLTEGILTKLPRAEQSAWTLTEIVKATDAKETTVREALKKLERNGVVVKRQRDPEKKLSKSNQFVYWIKGNPGAKVRQEKF